MITGVPCDCVWCRVDRDKRRPQFVARWRDSDDYWPAYRGGTAVPRGQAALIGPGHVARITSAAFVIEKASRESNE